MSIIMEYPETKALYNLRQDEYARVMDSIEVYQCDRRTWTERTEDDAGFDPDVTYVPDVWRYNPYMTGGKPDFVAMTERVQHWIFRINVERVLGYRLTNEAYKTLWKNQLYLYKLQQKTKTGDGSAYIKWWNQLFAGDRSHTNGAGVDTRTNFIAEENMEKIDYPKLFHIFTGRFVGKVIDRTSDKVGFECINIALGDLERYHPLTHPHLFDQPIVTGRYLTPTKAGVTITGYWWRVYYHFQKQVVIPFTLPVDGVSWYPSYLTVTGGVPLSKDVA